MLFRFSLYGFLKNQRYFEPFLVLVFLEKGLSYFAIGLLISFREVIVNALEIPSGAAADVYGRRKSMIFSFSAYIASFALFGLAKGVGMLFAAMALFAVGEAFRTGTHKAMIFTWLRLAGRTAERTRVYGYTRSWSKYGSALSVVLAAVFVYTSDSYTYVFYFSIIPYVLGLVNFLGYPGELDGLHEEGPTLRSVLGHLKATFRDMAGSRYVRRLVFESMGYQGVFEAVKDYLQPVLKAAAIAAAAGWIATTGMSDTQQTTLLVGPVYLVLYLASGLASRWSHRVASASGGEDGGARAMWAVGLLIFLVLGVSGYLRSNALLIAAFVSLHVIQNLWRPIMLGRFDAGSSEAQGATVLSIESQARRVATIVIAPILGLSIDWVKAHGPGGPFWPVGVVGAAVALLFLVTSARMSPSTDAASGSDARVA
jgi:MFS family permease